MKCLLAFVNSFCIICELLCNIMSHCIHKSDRCSHRTASLNRFPALRLCSNWGSHALFQDINSHRTMFQCYNCLEVLTITGPCLKVTGQTFKGLPFTGHVFMYSADFPHRVFGGCTGQEHRSVLLYYKTIGTVVPMHWLVFQELTSHRNKLTNCCSEMCGNISSYCTHQEDRFYC